MHYCVLAPAVLLVLHVDLRWQTINFNLPRIYRLLVDCGLLFARLWLGRRRKFGQIQLRYWGIRLLSL